MKTSTLVALFILIPAAVFAQTAVSVAIAPSSIARIEVVPPSIKTGEITPFNLAATAYDASGKIVPTTFTFAAADSSLVSVTPQGRGNTWSLGSTVIVVSSVDAPHVTAKVPVDVATPVAIEIVPSAATIAQGSQVQYELIGSWADGRREQISGAIQAENPGIASIDSQRLVRGNAIGSTRLAVTIQGPRRSWSTETGVTVGNPSQVTATETVTSVAVTGDPKPTLQQLELSPANLTAQVGSKVGYAAVGVFSDGSRKILPASWAATPNVALVDGSGNVLAQSSGDAKIVATVATSNGPLSATTGLRVVEAARAR